MEQNYRSDFPLLNNHDIVYLDSAATAQRPQCVLDAVQEYDRCYNANPLRGFYDLAMEATDQYQLARETVRKFFNARRNTEIIFTRNTTESINLVAYSWGLYNLKAGDEILITVAEHHSNMLPWQMVSRQTGATLRYLECDPDGSYPEERVRAAVTPNTRLAAVQQVSNVLGTTTPVELITRLVHANGGVVLVDGAQSAPHQPVDVQAMDVDFFACSGHKMMAPMGIGVLYGKERLLNKMPPFLTGGEMIESVTRTGATYAELPHKFEAGTVNGGGAAGLRAAIEYISSIGFEKIQAMEDELTCYAFEKLSAIPGVKILGSADPHRHHGILSFVVDGVHPHDISAILNEDGVAVRAGHHCAQPLLAHLKVYSCTRASISFYNNRQDIDRLVDSLASVRRRMGLGT